MKERIPDWILWKTWQPNKSQKAREEKKRKNFQNERAEYTAIWWWWVSFGQNGKIWTTQTRKRKFTKKKTTKQTKGDYNILFAFSFLGEKIIREKNKKRSKIRIILYVRKGPSSTIRCTPDIDVLKWRIGVELWVWLFLLYCLCHCHVYRHAEYNSKLQLVEDKLGRSSNF